MASWTSSTKNSATWSTESENLEVSDFLLESGRYLLLEQGDNLLLEPDATQITWTSLTKN